eukprot:403350549
MSTFNDFTKDSHEVLGLDIPQIQSKTHDLQILKRFKAFSEQFTELITEAYETIESSAASQTNKLHGAKIEKVFQMLLSVVQCQSFETIYQQVPDFQNYQDKAIQQCYKYYFSSKQTQAVKDQIKYGKNSYQQQQNKSEVIREVVQNNIDFMLDYSKKQQQQQKMDQGNQNPRKNNLVIDKENLRRIYDKYKQNRLTDHWESKVKNIDEMIDNVFQSNTTVEEDVLNIDEVFQVVKQIVQRGMQREHPGCHLLMYGSCVNGLALKGNSDLDMTLIIDNLEIDHQNVLRKIESLLRSKNSNYGNRFQNLHIKMIKSGAHITFLDKETNIDLEISINKILEVYNSQLLYTYALADARFHKLVVLLKKWNKNNFPDASRRINSYSIVLMLLAVMQGEKIMPKLQIINREEGQQRMIRYQKYVQNPNNFNLINTIYEADVYFESDLDQIGKSFKPAIYLPSKKLHTPAEILILFFRTYIFLFNSTNHGIDVTNNVQFKDKSLIKLEILKQFQESDTYIQANVLNDIKNFTFMIVDPFDKSYNPAKASRIGCDLEKNFFKKLNETFDDLMNDQKFDQFIKWR